MKKHERKYSIQDDQLSENTDTDKNVEIQNSSKTRSRKQKVEFGRNSPCFSNYLQPSVE